MKNDNARVIGIFGMINRIIHIIVPVNKIYRNYRKRTTEIKLF